MTQNKKAEHKRKRNEIRIVNKETVNQIQIFFVNVIKQKRNTNAKLCERKEK